MIYEFLKNKGVLENLLSRRVIDIGSGDGKHGKEFESHGWEVTYIEKKDGLDATTYDYPGDTFGLAIARNSLPFMGDKQFEVVAKIYFTLVKGGYFYGTVFGHEEPWAKTGIITPLDFTDVETYLKKIGFDILWQSTEKGIGKAQNGEVKQWHIFKFLCQKKSTN